jgi:hypothetical protein
MRGHSSSDVTLLENRQIEQIERLRRTFNKCYLIHNIGQTETQFEWYMLRELEFSGLPTK